MTSAHQEAIIAALREPVPEGRPRWTPTLLAKTTGLTKVDALAAIQSLRFAGKIRFDVLALSGSMIEPSTSYAVGAIPPGPGGGDGEAGVAASPPISQAKTGIEADAADQASAEPVSRPDAGRSASAMAEHMAATAGETADAGAAGDPCAAPASTRRGQLLRDIHQEALDRAARRREAGKLGALGGNRLSVTREAIQVALIDTPEDAFNFLRRRWPRLLGRIVADGRAEHLPPGPMLARVIEAGLLRLAEDRAEASA